MQSRFAFGGLAVAAITAIGGLGLAGLASPASAAPAAAAAVTIPAKPYDFNGDGYVDEAIGSPYGTVSGHKSAGFVNIIYGSTKGLNTAKHQVFSQNSANVPGTAEGTDHFGYALASADFNQDGYADLAIGVPDEDTPNGANAGTVDYLFGSKSGLVAVAGAADDEPVSTDDQGNVISGPGPSHRWGESLSIGDIEHDGFVELFITIPGNGDVGIFTTKPEPTPAAKGAEGAKRIFASRGVVAGRQSAKSSAKGEVGTLSTADVNSSWVATGDVTGDGHDDLVYAWYDADWPDPAGRHGFKVLPGAADGGLSDAPEIDGVDVNSLTLGDFNGDGFADVAVGQTADANHRGGQVKVYKGAATNVTADAGGSYVLNQETPFVEGSGETGDGFGASVAAGDINKDGKADLAIGAPTEDVGKVADAGATFVLYGSATGVTGAGSQVFTQNTAGVPGGAEKGDKAGTQVTLLDDNKDGLSDLTIGAPAENAGDGVITWLKGTTSRLTTTGCIAVYAPTFGVKGKKAELGRRLGRLG
ncbi:MAG TPA: hypothetical protein VF069_27440 [Streptosporangiaceae bacterium]